MWVRRGTTSMRQQKWSAPSGAVRTQRFSGGTLPSLRPRRSQAVVQQRGAGRAVVLEARARHARREHELEGQPRAVGGHEDGVVVDGDDAVAQLDLLLDEVLQQVAAHRALRVGAEALALAGHDGGDEVQRVDLRVRVRQRRAGLAALVDDDVHVRRAVLGVRAHPLAPDVERVGDLADLEVGQRDDRVGRVDDDLVGAARGRDAEQVGLGERLGLRARRDRAPGRGWARRARASPGVSGAPPLARSA